MPPFHFHCTAAAASAAAADNHHDNEQETRPMNDTRPSTQLNSAIVLTKQLKRRVFRPINTQSKRTGGVMNYENCSLLHSDNIHNRIYFHNYTIDDDVSKLSTNKGLYAEAVGQATDEILDAITRQQLSPLLIPRDPR